MAEKFDSAERMTLEDKKKRAESLAKAGNHADAAEVWKEIVQDQPDANAWWAYGKALKDSKQFDEAISAFREMLKLAPSFAQGWVTLAFTYHALKKGDEAEKAALHALRLERKSISAYYIISGVRSERKDWAGQIEILEKLEELGSADAADLNTLGIAHANLSQHGEAIRYYRMALRKERTVYPAFNVGLTYEKIGQRLDALDAYQDSLRIDANYEPAKKALARVQQALVNLDKHFNGLATVLPREEWYRNYINPFELFGADRTEGICEFDLKKYAGLKKRVLHGIALDDGKAENLHGHMIDASIVEDAYREILDETRRTYHWHVFSSQKLLDFLTSGDVRHFLYENGESPFALLDMIEQNEGFRSWLSEIFAKQYNQVLGYALKDCDAPVVEALLDGRRWSEPEHDDICFERAHRIVADMVLPLQQIRAESKTTAPRIEPIREIVIGDPQKQERLRILNKLPIQFRDQVNEVVASIRSIAIDCHNKHEQSQLSFEILQITQRLPIRDSKLNELIKEDVSTIDKIVKEDAANRFEALIFKDKTLRISKKGIEYAGLFVRTEDVRTLCWGIYIHRVNGVETQHNYSITIGGAKGGINIVWDCDGLIMGLAKKVFRDKDAAIPVRDRSSGEQDAYFSRIVDSVFNTVAPTLLTHILSEFDSGRTITVGACTLSKHGAAFRTGLIFKDDHQIPWSDLDTASGNGQITLCHRFKRSTSIAFNAKSTANAVMLPPLVRILKK